MGNFKCISEAVAITLYSLEHKFCKENGPEKPFHVQVPSIISFQQDQDQTPSYQQEKAKTL